jgi:hypothetical protein
MTPRRVFAKGLVRHDHNEPLVHATKANADIVRTTFWTRRCGCGHDRGAHRHYRRGSDCSLCDCPRWSSGWFIYQMARRLWR